MLNDTLYRIRRIEGLQQLQKRGEGGARELTSSRLRLAPGASYRYQIAAEETVLVLQEGKGTFTTPDGTWTLSRKNVFEERASAVYVPPGTTLTVTAETALEAILVSTPAPAGGHAHATGPDGIEVNERGKGNYSRLLVVGAGHQFIANGTLEPLLRGITGDATNTFTPVLGDT